MLNFKEVLFIEFRNGDKETKYSKITIIDKTSLLSRYNIVKDMLKKVSEKSLDLVKTKSIHFTTGCTVPRYKLKEFNKIHGLSVIKDSTKADAIITSSKSLYSLFSDDYYNTYPRLELLEFFEKHFIGDILQEHHHNKTISNVVFKDKDQFIKELQESNCDFVLLSWQMSDLINKYIIANKSPFVITTSNKILCSIKKSDIAVINKFYDPTSNIYPETEILKHLNLGPIIDVDMYNQLKTMINSPDKSNLIVAMEIMSNCNYDESIVYLSLLFREFYETTIMKTNEKNHINFKSLISYLSYNNIRNIQLDNILAVLIDKELLTRNNLNILLDLAHKEYKYIGDSEYFKITKVEVPPDILAKVTENEKIESESVCIEESQSGECLISTKFVVLDLSKDPGTSVTINSNP